VSITKIVVTSGTWAGGDAAGWIEFASATGTFSNNETVNISGGGSNVMTVNEPDTIIRIPRDLELAVMQQIAVEFQRQQKKEWGETSRSFGDGSISTMTEEELLPYVKEVLKKYRRLTI
jgi:thiamine pyrophosphate-dependent acetolactate synthase large subunit-like protein